MTTLNWFPSQTAAPPNGVALVIHGLNVRPDRMQPLIDCLNEAGIDCLSLALHGHGDANLEMVEPLFLSIEDSARAEQ